MRLKELSASFLKVIDEKHFEIRDELAGSDGVWFLCPKCFLDHGGEVGTHVVICWSPGVPQSIGPKPGRWNMEGTGVDDLTLVAGSSSVQLLGGCNAHFFVKQGEIVFS